MEKIGLALCAMVGCAWPSSAPAPDAQLADRDTWSGFVRDSRDPYPLLAGATVCVFGRYDIPCSTTDSTGTWTLELPLSSAHTDVAVVATAPGYLGQVMIDQQSPDAIELGVFLDIDPLAEIELGKAGFAYPDDANGFLEVYVETEGDGDPAPPGTTVSISPRSGIGPVYTDDNGTLDPALTATTTSGRVLFGNVAPGPVEVTLTAPGMTCAVTPGAGAWPPTSGGTYDVIVGAGVLTSDTGALCR